MVMGNNKKGALGIERTLLVKIPTILLLERVVSFSCGKNHSIFLLGKRKQISFFVVFFLYIFGFFQKMARYSVWDQTNMDK